MSEAPELESALWEQAVRLGIGVRPLVLHTGWRVGPVTAYLFPDAPVTLIDAGLDDPQSRAEIESGFAAAGIRIEDLERIIVTHGHTDHYGCSRWLQERSGCEVLMHHEDITRFTTDWTARARELMAPLGVSDDAMRRFFGGGSWPEPATLTALEPDATILAGGRALRILHRPGHSPGHVWVVDERSGAVFAGDYLLANSPTNAGLELDAGYPLGRLPMLQLYDAGLEELAGMPAPVIFPSHGPPITDHAELIRRRLEKSRRRTDHVLHALDEAGETTAMDLVARMYGERIGREPFGFIADVVGRLDLLVAEGRADARKSDSGVWMFNAS